MRWASEVIVDLLHAFDLPHAALNPGASYRGLHDSIVNYGGNRPAMMLCQHEETAVQIAHGFAKASGKPMVAILHNLVGLLHANMAVYYAYADRAPVFIIGATGPMDETKRRPRIDWIHTALVQGEAVRAYTKWDYQPTVIGGVPESFAVASSLLQLAADHWYGDEERCEEHRERDQVTDTPRRRQTPSDPRKREQLSNNQADVEPRTRESFARSFLVVGLQLLLDNHG